MPVQTKIQSRRDTAANWTSTNPTLASGEIGFETDTLKFKIGNGSTAWTSLSYQGASVSGLTPAGVVYGSSTGTITSSAQGVAGQFLMSYGDIANGGPQWINVAAMESVTVATTTALVGTYANNIPGTTPSTFTLTSTGVLTIDGYNIAAGDRILVKDQLVGSTPTYIANGVYLVTTAGATGVAAVLMRDNDADTMAKIAAMPISVDQGTTNGGLQWNCTNKTTDTMGTSAINFVKNNIGGVTQIVAGTNVTISPTGGTGVVTINSSGGGGGGSAGDSDQTILPSLIFS
jgi:hypothetical protein